MMLRLFFAAFAGVFLTGPLGAESLVPSDASQPDDLAVAADSTCWDENPVQYCGPHMCACNNHCSCWYTAADAFILHRTNGSDDQVVVLEDNTGDTVLTTGDLEFDFEAGPRLLVGRRLGCGWAGELSYFGTHFWRASETATDTNNLDIPGPLVAVANDFDNADQMELTYGSELHNAEFNVVHQHGCWSLLAGFRYLNLDERFNINATDNDGDVSDYTTSTRNNLYGGQLGARTRRRTSCRMWWELETKAGVFGNDADQDFLVQDNNNTVVLFDTSASDSEVSFIGDLNVTGVYALSRAWSLRTGYFVMYATSLALAPDQLDFTNDANTGTRINTDGDLFLHGFNLGLEARW
jgi:hypothetical protein